MTDGEEMSQTSGQGFVALSALRPADSQAASEDGFTVDITGGVSGSSLSSVHGDQSHPDTPGSCRLNFFVLLTDKLPSAWGFVGFVGVIFLSCDIRLPKLTSRCGAGTSFQKLIVYLRNKEEKWNIEPSR